MTRPARFAFVVLLFSPTVAFCQPATAVRFRDDFSADTRKEYEVRGAVGWRAGRLLLPEGTAAVRRLPLGYHARALAAVELDPAAGGVYLALPGRREAVVGLATDRGRVVLVHQTTAPPHVVDLGPAEEGRWMLRFEVWHGLARARAWPECRPEPAQWQSLRYTDSYSWQPAAVTLGGGKGGTFTWVQVRSTPQLTFTAGQQAAWNEAMSLTNDVARLYRAGRPGEALPKSRRVLELISRAVPDDHPEVAATFRDLGAVLQALGRYDEAAQALDQSVRRCEQALPPDHPHLAYTFATLASLRRERGDLDGAAALLRRAEMIQAGARPPLDVVTAQARANLGAVLHGLKRHEEALPLLEQSVAVQRKALAPGDPNLTAPLSLLADLLRDMDRPERARPLYEEALGLMRKYLPGAHPDLAVTLNNLGMLHRGARRRDEARPLFEEAVAIAEKSMSDAHPYRGLIFYNLARVLQEEGRFDRSRLLFEMALAAQKKSLPDSHPALLNTLGDLAGVLVAVGRHDEALPLLEKVVAAREKTLPSDHFDLGRSLDALGGLHLDRRRLRLARPLLERAQAIFEKQLPGSRTALGGALHSLSVLAEHEGDAAAALRYQRKAVATYEGATGVEHEPHQAASLGRLGWLEKKAGRPEEGLRLLRRSLEIRERALPALHWHRALSHLNLGGVLFELGRAEEAWPHLKAAAALGARSAAEMAAGSPQSDHGHFVGQQRIGLDFLLSVAGRLPELSAERQRDLLAAALDARAISATALWHARRAVATSADAETKALAARAQERRQRLAEGLLHDGPGQHDRSRLLQKEVDELERELAQRVKAYASLRAAYSAGPDEVVACLRPGEALIELLRYDEFDFHKLHWKPAQYFALVVSPGAGGRGPDVRAVRLGPAAPIAAALLAWRADVQLGKVDAGRERRLREFVWEPLAKALPPQTARLVIAPDGELALLPFEALRLDDSKYLVEHYAVRYVSSGRDLVSGQAPGRAGGALLLADPDYGAAPAGVGGLRFQPLAGFAREADVAARLLRGQAGWEVRSHRGGGASEETLAAASRPRLLYCITHGFFLEDVKRESPPQGARDIEVVGGRWPRLPETSRDPRLRSGLALAGANQWRERSAKGLSDGLLTALEVENLDLWGTELVVLSACDTGRGEIQVGEGVLGLRRAFQLAGAQTVLASLWKVPDEETERLMTDTLQRWLKGAPPHEALREAQLAMIRRLRAEGPRNATRGQVPPLYWAGFICHGGAR